MLFLLLLVACIACGRSGSSTDDKWRTPRLDRVQVVTEDIRLPFDRYELARADAVRAQQGNATLLRDCMRKRGFTVDFGGDYIRNPIHRPLWGGPVGTLPLSHAERFGYQSAPGGKFKAGVGFYSPSLDNVGLGGSVDGTQRSDPRFLQAYDTPKLSASERADLEAAGVALAPLPREGETSPQGCVQVVEESIGVRVVPVSDLDTQLFRLAEVVPEVAEAMQKWRACMRAHGHDDKYVTDPYVRFENEDVSPAQVATAVDDVACTASSGSSNYLYAAWADYQEQAIAKEPELFEAHLSSQKRRASAIQRELGRLR